MQSYSMTISKSTSNISKNTRESGSRRFYPGNSSSFGGCFEIFLRLSSGIRAVDALTSLGRSTPIAATPLPTALPIFTELYRRLPIFTESYRLFTDFYRILPTFYRFFGLSWETSAIKNYHSQDSRDSGSRRIDFLGNPVEYY